MTRLWLRNPADSSRYVGVGGDSLAPGGAVEYDEARPGHRATVDQIARDQAVGQAGLLELVECDDDPSVIVPEPAPEFSFRSTASERDHWLPGSENPFPSFAHVEQAPVAALEEAVAGEEAPASREEVAQYEARIARLREQYETERLPAPPIGAVSYSATHKKES